MSAQPTRAVMKAAARVVATALVSVTLALVGLSIISASSPRAAAATASDFQAGFIISDEKFYDSGSMSIAQIQAFLNGKVSTCNGTSMPCLKDYSQATNAFAADAYCAGLPAATMSSAEIIARVGLSCGISPKVLIVMLQKEQGLITSTAPSSTQYRSAMGMGCPDTAACDTKYYGFANQVYSAARQMKIYIAKPASYAYQLGWNNILYSPNAACGTKSVNIRNNATRVLYIYTPYTPNAAALANLYGLGDSCSAYGNRNFWRYYSDWFGSPTGFEVLGDMGARWRAIGGASSPIGSAIANEVCNWTPGNFNCYQIFEYGAISWTPSTGAWETYGDIRALWQSTGFEFGVMGYPTGAPLGSPGRMYQTFQGGSIGWSSSSGAFTVTGKYNERWIASGATTGPLGSPTGTVACGTKDNGCYQNFQNGAISWTAATGAWETYGVIRDRWKALGFENGALGYPVGVPTCGMKDNGCFQNFQMGAISWTAATGAWETYGDIRIRWAALGFETGVLSYPTAAPVCDATASSCHQDYQGGAISWTKTTGAWETYGDIRTLWTALGLEAGTLGYPTGAPVLTTGRAYQTFQNGSIGWSASNGAFAVTGDMNTRWLATGATKGVLGSPTGSAVCGVKDGGCFQTFQNGALDWSKATGAWETYGDIRALWASLGWESSVVGYPTAAPVTENGGTYQAFQNGTIAHSASGTFAVTNDIATRWSALSSASGVLGYQTGNAVCGIKAGGCYQNFQKGAITWTSAIGAWETYGDIRTGWAALGFENSALGYPTAAPVAAKSGTSQAFEHGTLAHSASGTFSITGVIGTRWAALSSASGVMGYPTGNAVCGIKSAGCYQNFQGGAITWTSATGAWETYGDIRSRWGALGFENGPLGYPTAAPVTITGRAFQTFQGGSIGWSTGKGAHHILGQMNARWIALGATASALGSPVADEVCSWTPGKENCYQNFQGGAISWTPSTGAWETYGGIRAYWASKGFEFGPLGYPTGAVTKTATGETQKFQGGTVSWDSTTGLVTTS